MNEKLLIIQKMYDFVLWIYPLINRIPKSHRLILGRQIENLVISILISMIRANKTRGSHRQMLQQHVSDNLDCLRILVRLCKDLRFMSIAQYRNTVERLNEIGKMLHGWRKAGER